LRSEWLRYIPATEQVPYENERDVTHHLEVREREFAALEISADPQKPQRMMLSRAKQKEQQ